MDGPLTNQDRLNINKSLSDLSMAVIECDKAEMAGVDCSEQRKMIEFLTEQLEKRKKVYFPGKP